MQSEGHPNASFPVSKLFTCLTVWSSEQSFTFTFSRLHIVQTMARAVFSTHMCDIELIGDTTICPLEALIADALP